jgi:NADPH2:quinone reductase
MPRAIRIHETGGPEVLRLEDFDIEVPSAGEVQVLHTAIGVNFIDVYDRSGLYPQKHMPAGVGREAAGIVVSLGKGVRGFRQGDRVAYVHGIPGSYCEVRNVPADRLVKIPVRRERRAGRGADAQGHDGRLSIAAYVPRAAR